MVKKHVVTEALKPFLALAVRIAVVMPLLVACRFWRTPCLLTAGGSIQTDLGRDRTTKDQC